MTIERSYARLKDGVVAILTPKRQFKKVPANLGIVGPGDALEAND